MMTSRMGTSDGAIAKRVVIVSRVKRNPYVELLCQGLKQPALGLFPKIVDHFSLGWMWRQRGQVDILHLHWLEMLFVYPSLWRSLKRWLSVMLGLCFARLSGVCIVYTVHNIQQHEGQRALLSRWGNHIILALAQAIHVHDAGVARDLAMDWGRRHNVFVIPHGNYSQAYGNTCSRKEARRRLDLAEDAFVYLFLGRVRPYKGIEELLGAFRDLESPRAVLLVAGEVQDAGYDRILRELAGADARIRLHLQFVPDEDLQVYLNGCDLGVLPYRHVTTSGAAILYFSFGVPIIAPRIGYFVDIVGQESRGLFYASGQSASLQEALRRAPEADIEAMRRACQRYAMDLDWAIIAQQHAAVYHQCEGRNIPGMGTSL